jgi:hypothetical protein
VKDSVVATNQVSTFKEVLPAGETQRFYRLWALP